MYKRQVAWRAADDAAVAAANGADEAAGAAPKAKLALEKVPFCGSYTVPLSRFDKGVVGAKARNTKALNESLGGGKIPSWIKLPKSMVIPFGTMEHVMDDPSNAATKAKMRSLERAVDDSSEQALEASLRACRECVLELVPPRGAWTRSRRRCSMPASLPPSRPSAGRWRGAL